MDRQGSSSNHPQIYPPSPGAARRRPTAKMGRIDTSGMSFGAVYGLSCVSACVAETITFPLDIVKTRVQAERMSMYVSQQAFSSFDQSTLQHHHHNHHSQQLGGSYAQYRARVAQIFRESVAKEQGGYMNLFRGLTPACLRHLIYSGSRIGIYEFLREDVLQREADGTFPLWKAVVGGMASGALAQFLSSPTDIIKVRMQTEYGRMRAGLPPLYRSTWQAFLSVAQEGGIRALWRGWAPNCQRAALVQLGDLTTYDLVKHRLLREDWGFRDNAVTHACSSLAAGLVAAALGTPADLVKTRIMNQPVDPVTGKGLQYRSSLHCLVTIVKEEGALALWRGFALSYARMAPWSLTFFLSFEQLRKAYGLASF